MTSSRDLSLMRSSLKIDAGGGRVLEEGESKIDAGLAGAYLPSTGGRDEGRFGGVGTADVRVAAIGTRSI